MKVVKALFVLCGAKFYMDWILPTNWRTKNPLIKFFYKKHTQTNFIDPKDRILFSKITGLTHLGSGIICFSGSVTLSLLLLNLLINIYPIIIQCYIAYRCKMIIEYRNKLKLQLV